MHIARLGLTPLLMTVLACATATQGDRPRQGDGTYRTAAEMELPRCDPAVMSALDSDRELGDWRQVRADGFRFCVPGTWYRGLNASGFGGWMGGGGVLSGFRTAEKSMTRYVYNSARVATPERNIQRVEIQGVKGELWDYPLRDDRHRQTYRTGALFEERGVLLSGTAPTRRAVHLQLLVYRTVRFDDSATPLPDTTRATN